MLNAIEDTGKIVGRERPGGHGAGGGSGPAVAQQNASWLNYGKVAEQALPVFRNVVEAVTYALFPCSCCCLLTSGRETMIMFGLRLHSDLTALAAAVRDPELHGVVYALDLMQRLILVIGTKALASHRSTIYSRAIGRSGVAIGDQRALHCLGGTQRMENMGTALVGLRSAGYGLAKSSALLVT